MLCKSNLLTLETIVYSWYILMSIVVWAQMTVFTHVMFYDDYWDRLGTPGRAPRTRETLPDFLESCRVTRHSRVFRGLTGCQRTLGNGASYLGIRTKVNNYLGSSVGIEFR